MHERNEYTTLILSKDRNDPPMASATIEPRLIALLNDTAADFSYPRIDLPPLQTPGVLKASRRLSPLEPDASSSIAKHDTLSTQQTSTFDRDLSNNPIATVSPEAKDTPTERALGGNSPHALRKILEDPEIAETSPSKKRQRQENNKDDFVQLPQPPKKQRAIKQSFPPIIIGLYEPPPNAALFPPISSSSFHDSHGRSSLNSTPQQVPNADAIARLQPKPMENQGQPQANNQPLAGRSRKKWSEEETNDLLLGVQKHGIGSWTKILHDSSFKFNDRKPVDLKDRFRTCCPTELRTREKRTSIDAKFGEDIARSSKAKSKSSLLFENILVSSSDESNNEETAESGPSTKLRKTRAHRKKLEDLVELGIKGPFKESQRRERKPFTEEEDRNILQGFEEYGPLWTAIQKDTRYGLGNRRPTDLRDRLRNKYPEKYVPEEDNKKLSKELDVSVQAAALSQQMSSSQASEAHPNQERATRKSAPAFDEKGSVKPFTLPRSLYNSFSDFLGPVTSIDVPDSLSFTQNLEWGETIAPFSSSMGDMDISRLLLDDSCWNANFTNNNIKQKPSYTDISSICTSTSAGFSSLYNTVGSDPQQGFDLQVSPSKESGRNSS